MDLRPILGKVNRIGRRLAIVTVAASLLGVAVGRGAAQTNLSECPQLVRTALNATQNFCRGTGRNQLCYGHSLLEVEPLDSNIEFSFEKPGDVVDALLMRALRVSEMNINSGYWGVALMRLQANLPDTLPGQNVTLLLFGDVELRSASTHSRTVDMVANETLTVRAGPSTDNLPVAYLEAGEAIVATGRLRDSSWLLVNLPGETFRSGWVVSSLLTPVLGTIESLDVVAPQLNPPSYGPLQAFYLKTGVNEPVCAEVPTNGLLIQTPRNAHNVSLVINDVEMTLGSTVFVEAAPGRSMSIMTLEGMARVSHAGEEQVAVPGAVVEVPVDETLKPSGPPQPSRPYDRRKAETLPVEALDVPVPVPPPITEDEAERINEIVEQGAPLCGVQGLPPCDDSVPATSDAAQGSAGPAVETTVEPTSTREATPTATGIPTNTPSPLPTNTLPAATWTATRAETTENPTMPPANESGTPVGADATNTKPPSGGSDATVMPPTAASTLTATPAITTAPPTATRTSSPVPTIAPPTATRTSSPVPTIAPPTATRTSSPVPTIAPPMATRTSSPVPTIAPPTATRTAPPSNTEEPRPYASSTATSRPWWYGRPRTATPTPTPAHSLM